MDLVNSSSCSFALRRSYCDSNTSGSENLGLFRFSKLVDDLITKRNILSKCCSTSTSNALDGSNNSKVVTVDLESEQDEKMDLQNEQMVDLKEVVLTLEKEAEKRFDSLNVEFRMQLVEAKEMNIALKEQILKIREEFIPMKQYNDLKESYEKKIVDLGIDKKFNLENFHQQFSSPIINNNHQEIEIEKKVTPMNSLEYIKTAHKMEMDELRANLEKECEKRLLEQRTNLEKENTLKLAQLRAELAQCLVISIDKEVQTDDGINLDDGLMSSRDNNSQKSPEIAETVDQSINHKSTLSMDKEIQTHHDTFFEDELMIDQDDNFQKLSEIIENQSILIKDSLFSNSLKRPISEGNCSQEVARQSNECLIRMSSGSPQKKRKRLSDNCPIPHLHSTPKPSSSFNETGSNSYTSALKNLIKSNEGYKIPSTHLAVRMCFRCRWVERIMAHDYARHFKTKHSSVNLGEETMLSQFKLMIIDKSMYTLLKDPKTRNSPSDSTVESNSINLPAKFIFVQFCSICRWMETVRRGSYQRHFKDYHSSSAEEEPNSQCELIVMKMTRFKFLRNKWLENSKRKESEPNYGEIQF